MQQPLCSFVRKISSSQKKTTKIHLLAVLEETEQVKSNQPSRFPTCLFTMGEHITCFNSIFIILTTEACNNTDIRVAIRTKRKIANYRMTMSTLFSFIAPLCFMNPSGARQVCFFHIEG